MEAPLTIAGFFTAVAAVICVIAAIQDARRRYWFDAIFFGSCALIAVVAGVVIEFTSAVVSLLEASQ